MADEDPRELQRFIDAQDPVFHTALAELRAGAKRTHWMWFVFPQLRVLGRSATARYFGLADLDEARAYLAHPVLGARLRECVQAVMSVQGRTLHQIFGSPDDLKFCSCMTLFEAAAGPGSLFSLALDRWCEGRRCERSVLALRQ